MNDSSPSSLFSDDRQRPKTNVAYVMPTYPSPSQTFIRREIAALRDQGLPIHRFAMRPFDGELVDPADQAERRDVTYLLENGMLGLVPALVLDALTRPRRFAQALRMALRMGFKSGRGLLLHLAYLGEACLLRRRLQEKQVAHVHTHFGTNSATVVMLCRLLGGPRYSVTVHGPEEFDAPRHLFLREKVHHAAFVIAISQFTRAQLYCWSDYADWRKIHVIHCGLDSHFLSTPRVPVPCRPRLIALGRLTEQKGQLLLLRAAKRLRERHIDFEIVMIGDGPMRGEIQHTIELLGLDHQVRITGYLSSHDIRQQLQAARALVMPSFAEGLPVAIMEALALGRPVITTSIAGIPELVEDGVNGWLVPAGAVEPLVDAMAEALTAETSELDMMGDEGATKVARRHNVETEAGKLAELIMASTLDRSSPREHDASDEPRRADRYGRISGILAS